MSEDTYKTLFEKQRVIIDRMKKEMDSLEKIQKKLDSKRERIDNDELEDSSSIDSNSAFFESDTESIDLDEANISDNLRIALGLQPKCGAIENTIWRPPSISGLDNSDPLIDKKK